MTSWKKIALGLLVAAGAAAATVATLDDDGTPSSVLTSECVTPEEHGAIADDEIDDRVAMQAAIDAAIAGPKCLALGSGEYHVTRRPEPGIANIASLQVHGPLLISGTGVISMLGSGIRPGTTNPADWTLLSVKNATDVRLSGFALRGDNRTSTQEQTHLLVLQGPTDRVVVDGLHLSLPQLEPVGVPDAATGGDCIRLLGEFETRVRNTEIRNVTGENCDRSWVAVQRGVDGLLIADSEVIAVGDQAIDMEPTGAGSFQCAASISNVIMRDLVLRRGTPAQGDLTVAIAGDDCAKVEGVTLERSVVEDGAVSIIDARDVTLARLFLRNRLASGSLKATLHIRRRAEMIKVVDTLIERVAGSAPSYVVEINENNGIGPTDVTFAGVTVVQRTSQIPVSANSLDSFVATGCRFEYFGTFNPNRTAVVAIGTFTHPVGSPVIVDSVIVGPLAGAARVGGVFLGPPVVVRTTGP